MKTELIEIEKEEFNPVKITITIESKEELMTLYAMSVCANPYLYNNVHKLMGDTRLVRLDQLAELLNRIIITKI